MLDLKKCNKGGKFKMTVQKGIDLSSKEFEELYIKCQQFDSMIYKNNPIIRNEGETYGDFIENGSFRIKNNPVLQNKLI